MYRTNLLTGERWAAMKTNYWDCSCLNCEVSYVQSAWLVLDRSMHWLYGSFGVDSSYTKLVRAVYRQRVYNYLVQFSGMLHCWLQRCHVRIRTTFETPLVYLAWKCVFKNACKCYMVSLITIISNLDVVKPCIKTCR